MRSLRARFFSLTSPPLPQQTSTTCVLRLRISVSSDLYLIESERFSAYSGKIHTKSASRLFSSKNVKSAPVLLMALASCAASLSALHRFRSSAEHLSGQACAWRKNLQKARSARSRCAACSHSAMSSPRRWPRSVRPFFGLCLCLLYHIPAMQKFLRCLLVKIAC